MTAVLAVLAALLALVLGVSALRIELVATVHVDGGAAARMEARALFGWIRVRLARGAKEHERPEEDDDEGTGGFRAPTFDDGRRLLDLALELLGRLARRVRLSRLEGDVLVGLDDPADTGMLWGAIGPAAVLAGERHPDFRVRPSFAEPMLFVDVIAALAFRPLFLVGTVLVALLRPRTLALLIRVVRGRR